MGRKGSEGVSLGRGKCIKSTGRALLIEFEDDDADELWIPASQIHDDSEVYDEEHTGDVVVKAWWAEKEGLT